MTRADPVPAELLVVTGMSGAGRSAAVDHLEDLGWHAIDNLPARLIPDVLRLPRPPGPVADRVALAIGGRSVEEDLLPVLADLRATGVRLRLVFLDATDEVLVRRFDATRRRHPLSGPGESLLATLDRERRALAAVRTEADVVLSTTELSVHELRGRIRSLVDGDAAAGDRLALLSFGFKHGIPLDADLVLDCRFLANPQYVDELRPHTGLDPAVRDFVLGQPASATFLADLERLLAHLLPAYAAEGRAYLTVALGCTGGRHRSVALTEQVAARLRRLGHASSVLHRDLDR